MWFGLGVLVVVMVGHKYGDALTADDRNTYVCYEGKCVTKATLGSVEVANTTYFKSMENCRLLCGRNGNLWPLPTISGALGNELAAISPANMKLIIESSNSNEVQKFLNDVFVIFRDTMVEECGPNSPVWSSLPVRLHLKVTENSLVLDRSTSEEYRLTIQNGVGGLDVEINATTVFGARHGLETLSQLTGRYIETDRKSCNVYLLTSAQIRDKPVFPHRGLLVDTARNFIPLVDLKRTVRAMGAVKLNVFHWHATDSHSFPLLIKKVPALAEMGAYSPQEVYTEDDIKELVEYAKLRGVRILMEIDSPAHAGNGWQFGEKQGLGQLVVCRNQVPWRSACVQPPCGQMNPANPNLYPLLSELYSGLKDLIPSNDLFHMGGDEVYIGCWNQSEQIVDYMTQKKYPLTTEGFIQLWTEFHVKALQAWDRAIGHTNTKIILWTSDLTNPATIPASIDNKRFIIEAWTDQYDRTPYELLRKGYEVIFATTDVWYLDHGFWGRTTYHTWKNVYDYRIPEEPLVLGGEAALWSEYADSHSLDTRLWPRGAALAERLWSSPSSGSGEAEYRLLETRQRLVRRGINPDQVIPQWCYLNEGLC